MILSSLLEDKIKDMENTISQYKGYGPHSRTADDLVCHLQLCIKMVKEMQKIVSEPKIHVNYGKRGK